MTWHAWQVPPSFWYMLNTSRQSIVEKRNYHPEAVPTPAMVRLVITPTIRAALRECLRLEQTEQDTTPDQHLAEETPGSALTDDALGSPIAHERLVTMSKTLRRAFPATASYRLSSMLRGTSVYHDPPAPKPEPTPEFSALMARLRQERDEDMYQRMVGQRLDDRLGPMGAKDSHEEDEVTFADVNRQLTLILNVLISIVFCAVAIWLTAWHWDVPMRLFASMGGSIVVGVAEVTIYAGYLRRLKQAKAKERKKKEIRHTEPLFAVKKRQ